MNIMVQKDQLVARREPSSRMKSASKRTCSPIPESSYLSPMIQEQHIIGGNITAVKLKKKLANRAIKSSTSSQSTINESLSDDVKTVIPLPRTASTESLRNAEQSIAQLLAELSGHTIDLSSPTAKDKKLRKKSLKSFMDDGGDYFGSVPIQRTQSGVSIGNVLISLGRARSHSVDVLSNPTSFDFNPGRPRAGTLGQLGIYPPAIRRMKIERYMEKRKHRVWGKKIKYDVRKNFADSRVRIKGRFVRKDEELDVRSDRSNSITTDVLDSE
jgi:hypothetical protein